MMDMQGHVAMRGTRMWAGAQRYMHIQTQNTPEHETLGYREWHWAEVQTDVGSVYAGTHCHSHGVTAHRNTQTE